MDLSVKKKKFKLSVIAEIQFLVLMWHMDVAKDFCRKNGSPEDVMYQVSSESLEWTANWGPLALNRKEF